MDAAEEIVLNMSVPARDFLFIRHPSFNDIQYLDSLGLKLTWTDWEGHKNMAHTDRFRELCERHEWYYSMIPARQILDSKSKYVVPLDAPEDTTEYCEEQHGPKPLITFDRHIFSFTDIFIKLNDTMPRTEWFDILRRGSYHKNDLSVHHVSDA